MKGQIGTIIIVFILLGCKQNVTSNSNKKENNVQHLCLNNSDKTQIVQSIFENKYLLKHMDPRIKDSVLPLKVLKNIFITDSLPILFRNNMVVPIDSIDLTEETFRMNMTNVDCKKKKVGFTILYPIEGNWFAKGKVEYKEGKWVAIILSGGISD